jgi:hypothetical protein
MRFLQTFFFKKNKKNKKIEKIEKKKKGKQFLLLPSNNWGESPLNIRN